MTSDAIVIDCDGHVLEPPDLREKTRARLQGKDRRPLRS
jgi:hypothetical protein